MIIYFHGFDVHEFIAEQSILSLLGALSGFGTQIDHLQCVRNAAVHLSMESIVDIKTSIATRYSYKKAIQYPTDVLYARCIDRDY